ncbi:hypothetical protein J3459_012190 [Metarhizium acridum]|nr:hypothetical protein J3459_012190 [Metarhizium acridum]
MHINVALAARLVAYQRTRRFILVPTTTPLPIFSPTVGSSYMYKSCFICATQMIFFIPDPSAPFYSTFWGPQGKEAGQSSVAPHHPPPKGCTPPTKSTLTGSFLPNDSS